MIAWFGVQFWVCNSFSFTSRGQLSKGFSQVRSRMAGSRVSGVFLPTCNFLGIFFPPFFWCGAFYWEISRSVFPPPVFLFAN